MSSFLLSHKKHSMLWCLFKFILWLLVKGNRAQSSGELPLRTWTFVKKDGDVFADQHDCIESAKHYPTMTKVCNFFFLFMLFLLISYNCHTCEQQLLVFGKSSIYLREYGSASYVENHFLVLHRQFVLQECSDIMSWAKQPITNLNYESRGKWRWKIDLTWNGN